MSDIVLQRDVGSLGSLLRLSAAASAVAAGAGDSTTTTGATIDRMGFSSGSMPMTMAAAIIYDATLATAKTLSFGYAVQDSADGSTWADYQTATYAVVATGATAASVAAGQLEVGVNLTSARRFVRFNFAPDLSATQTDTAVARAVGFAAGFDRLPQ
ncbi:hypothetical protein BH10PSE14_BH10PSE14_06680 [soil metagenome]